MSRFGILQSGNFDPQNPVPSDFLAETRGTFLPSYADDAAFEAAISRAGQENDRYWNSTDKVIREHDGTSWRTLAPIIYPDYAIWFSSDTFVVAGNTKTAEVKKEFAYQFHEWQDTPAINDELRFPKVALNGGTYDLRILGYTNSASGIVTAYINGVSKGTIDLYSAAEVFSVEKTLSSIAITTGEVELTTKMESKNASSSDYLFDYTRALLIRTGA